MNRLSLLVKARETAEYFVNKKFKYSQGVANSWAGAKKKKVSNCASYVCYCLQQLGILKPGQLFYCNRNGTVAYKGAGTKAAISKRYRLIKVNKLPRNYKNKLKPGDICFYRLHTNIFAGINENNKMVWWDAGKASTNTKKAGGTYKKIHRIINSSQKILYVLRWKG